MKKILPLFFLLLSFLGYAQLDNEHWFAPMTKQSNNGYDLLYLYVSTNETTPFYIKIENNKKVFDSVQISKSNPKKVLLPVPLMISSTGNRIDSLGVRAFADKKFFANLRISQLNHAEIITSKGRAGLGKHFFTAYAPFSLSMSNLNYTVGIVATEDNTEVEIPGFTTTPIVLNKGKSYMWNGASPNNSFIGKEIKSTKPISVTTGNFNGQYAATNSNDGSDILMDQAVPIERLGYKYILMKGNGNTSNGMETALIIAIEDNTQIFFNGSATPETTLSKGAHYLMPSRFYIDRSPITSNAFITSNKNIYVYQLLSGSGTLAAGGMNYIPPLNCYLPKNIDEIGYINENPGYYSANGGYNYTDIHNTKLNIITEKNAQVKVNGNIINQIYGPYDVDGSPDWVTFTVPNITGNVTINSDRAVTAGIAAGDGVVGYGGYFAGASSMPIITKKGDCFPNITLEVDDTFTSFRWQRKNPATGIWEDVTGANTYFFRPKDLGEYRCIVGAEFCGELETPSYLILKCTYLSSQNFITCKHYTIKPKLSSVSTQTLNNSKTRIVSNGSIGNASVLANGDIYYEASSGFTDGSTDTFSYYLEGTGLFPDTEIVTVKITLRIAKLKNATVYSCINSSGEGSFYLSTADIFTDNISYQLNYFKDSSLTQPILNFSPYVAAPGKVYVEATNNIGCKDVAEITLAAHPIPNIDTSKYNAEHCDYDFDGKINIKFSNIVPVIVNGNSDFDVIFSVSNTFSTTLPNDWFYSSPTKVYVKVASKKGCDPIFGEINFKIANKIPVKDFTTGVCDNDLDGKAEDQLDKYLTQLISAPYTSVKYYSSLIDAQLNNTANQINISQLISGTKIFYIRFENGSSIDKDCPNIAKLTLFIKQPNTSTKLKDKLICKNSTTTLDAGSGFDYYKWSTGAEGQNLESISGVGVGDYWVDLSSNGCVYRQPVKITAAEDPTITHIDVSENTITVHVTGGTKPYYYSLDGINYQTENVFKNLPKGLQKVYVQGAERCNPVIKEFLIINLINVITPNDDGINDVLNYSDLRIKKDVKIEVYDRYGVKIYQSENNVYKWDGKFNRRAVPTATYWYILNWTEPDTNLPVSYKGWILVKNRN